MARASARSQGKGIEGHGVKGAGEGRLPHHRAPTMVEYTMPPTKTRSKDDEWPRLPDDLAGERTEDLIARLIFGALLVAGVGFSVGWLDAVGLAAVVLVGDFFR